MREEDGFDGVEFDAMAADFYLAIGAAEEFEVAVWKAAGEVAGFVEAFAGG